MNTHPLHAAASRAVRPIHPAPPRAGETVGIDLGQKPIGPIRHVGSGFLQGFDAAHPRDRFVNALGVNFVRDADPLYPMYGKLHRQGITAENVLAGLWEQANHAYVGNGYGGPWPGLVIRNGRGVVDWKPFDRFVTDTVKNRSRGKTFEWDIWNEPNAGNFWNPQAGKLHPKAWGWYLQMWKHAVQDIRAVDKSTHHHSVIVGPSFQNFGFAQALLPGFLRWAKKNNVLPDAISWHELDSKHPPSDITRHVDWVRGQLQAYPEVKRLEINEYGDRKNQFSPARTLGYLTALERAKVDAASHACWIEFGPNPADNGNNNSLDGLLGPHAKPRPNYWLYQRYAQMRGTLHDVHPSGHVDGLSSTDARGLKMLLANNGIHAFPVSVNLTGLDKVPALAKASRVRVRVELIEKSGNQGMDAVSGPRKVSDAWVTVTGGRAALHLPAAPPDGVWSVSVEP